MKRHAFATIFAVALTVTASTHGASAAPKRATGTAEHSDTHASSTATMRAMDTVEHSDYRMDAMIANDLYIVPDYIAIHRSEVKHLEVHAKEAVPSIVARMKSATPLHGAFTQAIYLRVLQLSQDSRALSVVADYLDSIPDSQPPIMTPSFLISTRIAKHWLHNDPLFAAENEDDVQIFRQRHQVARKLREVIASSHHPAADHASH